MNQPHRVVLLTGILLACAAAPSILRAQEKDAKPAETPSSAKPPNNPARLENLILLMATSLGSDVE